MTEPICEHESPRSVQPPLSWSILGYNSTLHIMVCHADKMYTHVIFYSKKVTVSIVYVKKYLKQWESGKCHAVLYVNGK